MTTEARFWAKVDQDGPGGCWLWTGTLGGGRYGRFYFDGRSVASHRYAYELLVGPIPDGLTIDHLCRVRHCVNPAHLEPVTNRENILRGTSPAAERSWRTHCPRGHSDYMIRQGRRTCRVCYRYSSNEMRVERRRQQRARERECPEREQRAVSPGPPTSSSPTAPGGAEAPDGMTTAPVLGAQSEPDVSTLLGTPRRDDSPAMAGASGSDPHPSHWRPPFVDNDARPVPTTWEPVQVKGGVL